MQNIIMMGIYMPLSYDVSSNSSCLIVNILEDEVSCFNTKERVPYKITLECVDPCELLKFLKNQIKMDKNLDLYFETDPQSISKRSLNSKEIILLQEFRMTGEFDNPARNQRSRDRLSKLGIATGIKTYKGGKHGCWNRLPWLDEMVPDMAIFFREHLK